MNNLYIEKLLHYYNFPIYSFPDQGHFLAADLLHNIEEILINNSYSDQNFMLVAPTVNNINVAILAKEVNFGK